jgi:hypothetical protein
LSLCLWHLQNNSSKMALFFVFPLLDLRSRFVFCPPSAFCRDHIKSPGTSRHLSFHNFTFFSKIQIYRHLSGRNILHIFHQFYWLLKLATSIFSNSIRVYYLGVYNYKHHLHLYFHFRFNYIMLSMWISNLIPPGTSRTARVKLNKRCVSINIGFSINIF